jgi:hypothetical protein
MFYWLFTEGRALLGGCLAPLLCLAAMAPFVVAVLLGAGIQRTGESPLFKGRRRVYLLAAYLLVDLGVTALYLALLGNFALTRQIGKPTTSDLILLLTGAPPNVNATRLLIVGLLLVCTWFIVSIGLHQTLRSGGWLRERVDRLRRPLVRRGAMGSSHFSPSANTAGTAARIGTA